MKKILFPTDFSESANKALTYALALAYDLDATIDIMHVYSAPFSDASRVPPDYIEQLLNEKKAAIDKKMNELIRSSNPELIGAKLKIYGLFPAAEIRARAIRGDYDLIVMGMKGEHDRLEKFIGTVTTSVLLHAICPVLAVPADAKYRPIKSIALATTMEPGEVKAVGQLNEIAQRVGANLRFVHINTGSDSGEIAEYTVLEKRPLCFVDFSVVNNFSVMQGVDDFLEKHPVEILALFIPRRRLLERLFHSSFTKQMAYHTHIPLLAFHE